MVGKMVLGPVGNGMISKGTPLMCVGLAFFRSLLVRERSFQMASWVVDMAVVYFIGGVFLRSVVVVGVRVICRAHADVLAKTVYGGIVEAVWDVVWVSEGRAKGEVDLFSEVIEGASGSIE